MRQVDAAFTCDHYNKKYYEVNIKNNGGNDAFSIIDIYCPDQK